MIESTELGSTYYVELNGEPIAKLFAPEFAEMFWTSFQLVPLTSDPDKTAILYKDEFWNNSIKSGVGFRRADSGELCPSALSTINPSQKLKETGRISIRGLYTERMLQRADRRQKRWHWFTRWFKREEDD